MATYKVGYFVGSLSSKSINRILSKALIRLAPHDLEFTEIPIGNLPLYSPDYDADYPSEATALKGAIAESDAVLFVTPEYNRSIPGALKNAIDWASRPWGQNSFDHIPAAVIGASIGPIGTAVSQQSLRGVLSFCNARQMTAPEAYVRYTPEIFTADGEVTDEAMAAFLSNFMSEFRTHLVRVLTVIPLQWAGASPRLTPVKKRPHLPGTANLRRCGAGSPRLLDRSLEDSTAGSDIDLPADLDPFWITSSAPLADLIRRHRDHLGGPGRSIHMIRMSYA
jgi:chromate reductase, NAD(P)H dehydrogenase (quinone)